MLSVFIFKSNSIGMQYGTGSYIKELTETMQMNPDIKIYLTNFYDNDCKEFAIESVSPQFCKIRIPSPYRNLRNDKFDKKYANVVVHLLSSIIPENEKVVFQVNNLDTIHIVRKLKEKYNYPIISVVHIALWQQLSNGNKENFEKLDLNNPTSMFGRFLANVKESYELSDRIVALTAYMKDYIINEFGVAPEKIDLIPNGINTERYKSVSLKERNRLKKSLGFCACEKIILFIGRVDQAKGILILIDAFLEACKVDDKLRLVIIGNGTIEQCMQRCQSFYGKITFTGFLQTEEINRFYQIADIGVSPSLHDQCPYTVLEMIANKIPLVLSKIEGLDEILNNQECVFIRPNIDDDGNRIFDTVELAQAILSLINDKHTAAKMTIAAYIALMNRHTALGMVENMIGTYKKASDEKSKVTNHSSPTAIII